MINPTYFDMLIFQQGSGKGTQSSRLVKNFGVTHLSSGDLLRKNIREGTWVGQQAKQYVTDGKLVPDGLLISLVNKELLHIGATVCIFYFFFSSGLFIYFFIELASGWISEND